MSACSNFYCGTGAVASVKGGLCDACLAIVWAPTPAAPPASAGRIEMADRSDYAMARDRTVHVAGSAIDMDDIPDRDEL